MDLCGTYRLVSSLLSLLLVFLGFFIASLCENQDVCVHLWIITTECTNSGDGFFKTVILLVNAKQDSLLKGTLTRFP